MPIDTPAQEAFKWMARVIDSCVTVFHLDCAGGMVDLYRDRYGENAHHATLLEMLSAKAPMATLG